MSEITNLRQTIDFLGFLRGQLSGLQGIPTLCYELIQNADDVKDADGNPGATRITFNVCDDALYVENDGVFRDIDFDRMQRVSWGNKREEANTTGAFGVGFISVYQVTDSPEIFSSGRHWKFQPNASENDRIIETKLETQFTKFRLPWAFETSEMRAELRIPPIDPSQLDDFVTQISQSIEAAALFLKQVTILEVKRSDNLVRRIETMKGGSQLLVVDGNSTVSWRILTGTFEAEAAGMRNRYGALIEVKRQPIVKIAIPDQVLENGLLYAFLPSETHTGLPFHINADFYPSQDRKRIPFELNFQSDWNNLAIECAANTLAAQTDEVLRLFKPADFWKFAENVKKASDAKTLSPTFALFWEKLKPQIRVKPTALTSSRKMTDPPHTVYLDTDDQVSATEILEFLGINTIHSDLRPSRNLLMETGTQILKISEITNGLLVRGMNHCKVISDVPKLLQPEANRVLLWKILEALYDRANYSEKNYAEQQLRKCALATGSDGALWPPEQLRDADEKTQHLFSQISPFIWFVSKPEEPRLVRSLVPGFSVKLGIETLQAYQETIIELWKNKKFSTLELYEWLEGFRYEISTNSTFQQTLRSCSIWPSADGTLKPLTQLYLAGDFDDPLHLAQLVDIDSLGGKREFLEKTLGVQKLDFITYIQYRVPSILKTHQLDRENHFRLLKVLAENLGKLQGREDLRQILADLPLVWCGGDRFLQARSVYFDSKDVRDVLEFTDNIAHLPIESTEAIRTFYDWLGVSKDPRVSDIISRIRKLISSPPNKDSSKSIESIFSYLALNWNNWAEGHQKQFFPLQKEAWLPGSKYPDRWCTAHEIYTIFQRFLFDSQGNFLVIDRQVQVKGSDFIKFLAIETEPLPEQVVRHLIFLSGKNEPVTPQLYVYLNYNADDKAIKYLIGRTCLYLETDSGTKKYMRPDQVFWEQHPFGHFRLRLSTSFGQFKPLLDQLCVKDRPDAEDAIKVLLEIADEFGSSNTTLDDHPDIETIVIQCWKLISLSLELGTIKPTRIKEALGNRKTIPNDGHLLIFPTKLFFEDRPGWGSKFTVIKNNMTKRIEGIWPAMEAAGVQRLSKAISTEIHKIENRQQDEDLPTRILDRRNLIQRVIQAHGDKGVSDFEIENLLSLDFIKADNIDIVRLFTGFGTHEHSQLESVDAIHLGGVLYYCALNQHYPWQAIARELAYVLHPSGELNSLGMELKEILSQTIQDANATLDDYGYPKISEAPTQLPEGAMAEPADVPLPPDSTADDTHRDTSEKKDRGDGHPPTIGAPPAGTPPATIVEKPIKRKTSRLYSYVNPEEEISTHSESEETTQKRLRTGQLGVDKVMQYEKENDRNPIDMETVQVHHPGYDIKSVDSNGQIRYIEVKTLSGSWDAQNPAQMTKTEFEMAMELGTSYWLYIVELVDSNNEKMYFIRNPANRADAYCFDFEWAKLSKQS